MAIANTTDINRLTRDLRRLRGDLSHLVDGVRKNVRQTQIAWPLRVQRRRSFWDAERLKSNATTVAGTAVALAALAGAVAMMRNSGRRTTWLIGAHPADRLRSAAMDGYARARRFGGL